MRSFEKRLDEFRIRGVQVVAISVDPPEINLEHRRKQGYSFPFLSDTDTAVLRQYDLVHAGGGPAGEDIARPAEFLIDHGGTVRWRDLTESYAVRTRPEAILEVVDRLATSPTSAAPGF